MTKVLVKFIFLLLPLYGSAQVEFDGDTVQISSKYYSGQFLIYDCESKHWSCVDKDGFKECQESRDQSKKEFKTYLKCAPIKEYKNLKECISHQKRKVHHPESTNFCKHQDLRKGITR